MVTSSSRPATGEATNGSGKAVPVLDPAVAALWRDMLTSHRRTLVALEEDLSSRTGLSLAQYDVLLHLHEAPEHRLRMSELSQAVLFTTSGLTRLIDRMEAAGWVERGRSSDDRRGVSATLTAAGAGMLKSAAAVHLEGVQRMFTRHLEPAEIPVLAAAFARLNAATT
ncbi:MAG: MarR family transcriptional regulator [Glaciihabitans sp.]|nr:MarR family transcriptional regulator [Glaciihabitans sp.]